MATIGELIINLNASTAAFVTELERVKNLSFDTAKQVERSFNLLGTVAVGMIGIAAGAFAEGINKTVEWEVHILHLAQAAGTSTEAMSGLSLAAKMMGLDIDQIAKAMERFDKQVLAAQAGNVKAGQNMSILGIDVAGLKTSDEALMKLADHIAAMPYGLAKTGAAAAAFGVKLGPAMIPLLAQGSKGIQDFIDEAGRMGLVITKDQAETAEHFEQNMTRMKESMHGLWVEITNLVLPTLDQLTTKFQDTAKTSGSKADAIWELIGAAFGSTSAGTGAVGSSTGGLAAYLKQGEEIIKNQEASRAKLTALTTSTNENKKAVDALKKSVESIITTYQTQIATMGMTNLQVTEYKLRADAAKLGNAGLLDSELKLIDALDRKKTWLERIAVLDNSKIDAEKKNFLADKLNLDLQDLDVARQKADLAMQTDMSQFTPTSSIGAAQQTEAFTQAYQQQMSELQHSIATWGMTTDQVTRYNMSLLDGSDEAKAMTANIIQLQDRLAHMENVTAAWREFENIATRTLDELIFSGKSLGSVMQDLVKQLGEMAIKWALFGGPADKGNGGLFGAIFGGIKHIFGLASGGPVAGGQTVMVGEKGPELFTPSTSGYVIPNGASAGGGSVNVVYQIDARGSSITEEQFRRSLAASEGRAVQRALNMTRETQLRTA